MSRQSILRRAFAEVMAKTPNGTPSMFEPLTDDGEFPDYMVESLYKEYEKIDVIVSSEAQARIAELENKVAALESLRPLWAQGYSADSVAAQVHAAALSQLWELLGAKHQTEAMAKLRELTK